MEAAQYTQDEWQRLKRGAEIHQEKQQRAAQRGGNPSPDQRRREQEALAKYR